MRRIRSQNPGRVARDTQAEPIYEGPAMAQARRPPGFYPRMGDEELAGFAAGVLKERGISSRAELRKKDFGLYTILRRRGLLNEIAYDRESVLAGPSSLDGEPRAQPAKDSAGELSIEAEKGLQEADPGKRSAMICQADAPEAVSPEKEPRMSILDGIREALGLYQKKDGPKNK